MSHDSTVVRKNNFLAIIKKNIFCSKERKKVFVALPKTTLPGFCFSSNDLTIFWSGHNREAFLEKMDLENSILGKEAFSFFEVFSTI